MYFYWIQCKLLKSKKNPIATQKRHRISWFRTWIGYIFLHLSGNPTTKSGKQAARNAKEQFSRSGSWRNWRLYDSRTRWSHKTKVYSNFSFSPIYKINGNLLPFQVSGDKNADKNDNWKHFEKRGPDWLLSWLYFDRLPRNSIFIFAISALGVPQIGAKGTN